MVISHSLELVIVPVSSIIVPEVASPSISEVSARTATPISWWGPRPFTVSLHMAALTTPVALVTPVTFFTVVRPRYSIETCTEVFLRAVLVSTQVAPKYLIEIQTKFQLS